MQRQSSFGSKRRKPEFLMVERTGGPIRVPSLLCSHTGSITANAYLLAKSVVVLPSSGDFPCFASPRLVVSLAPVHLADCAPQAEPPLPGDLSDQAPGLEQVQIGLRGGTGVGAMLHCQCGRNEGQGLEQGDQRGGSPA
jgi:hypothetical protein